MASRSPSPRAAGARTQARAPWWLVPWAARSISSRATWRTRTPAAWASSASSCRRWSWRLRSSHSSVTPAGPNLRAVRTLWMPATGVLVSMVMGS